MGREIKFRAWDEKNGKMEYPSMVDFHQSGSHTCYGCSSGYIDVESSELMQYTGLKDSKRTEEYPEGKEIYESDRFNINGEILTVVFEDGMFILVGDEEKIHEADPLWCYRNHPNFKVIENTYEGGTPNDNFT